MKKIIVAGAGHGGISAAKTLAENGYDVSVYEKKSRNAIGYDWRDCIYIKSFAEAGFEPPDKSLLYPFGDIAYYNHSKTVRLCTSGGTSDYLFMIERKQLLDYLIGCAEKAGTKFFFEKEIPEALCGENGVDGVVTADGEKLYADLVIDASGIDSPLRTKLPKRFGIMNKLNEKDVFNVYRAYYAKTEEKFTEPRNSIYFNHCGKHGMDWAVTEDGFIDVLVGAFGELENADIEAAVTDFKNDYPYMSSKVLRGGSVARIPLRRTLPVIVCSGYALVGDSASMTEPLSGSGVTCSLIAGKYLADTYISSGGDSSLPALWKYEYRYYKEHSERLMQEDIIRNALKIMNADELDYLFEKKIIGIKEIAGGKLTLPEIIGKAALAGKPSALAKFMKAFSGMARMNGVFAMMPEKYDAEEVTAWQKAYEKL